MTFSNLIGIVWVFMTVFLLDFTSGRGCYKDLKIYIVKLSHEDQHGLIVSAMEDCYKKNPGNGPSAKRSPLSCHI